MPYSDEIAKTEVPYFIELYDIVAPDWTLYLTPYRYSITYSNKKYTSCVMERTDFEIEKNEERTVTISFATKEDVSLTFMTYNVPKLRVTIRRYFPEASVAKIIFVGEGDIVGISNRVLTLKVVDILSMNKAKVPPLVYSAYCNNTLFDSRCGLTTLSYRLRTKFYYVSGNSQVLYSPLLKNYSADYFTYGYIEYGHHWRLITKHDNSNGYIYLHASFDESVDGKTMSAFAGCDKTPQTCQSKFNNLANFLGFPYIPLKNPVIWGVT